TVYVSFGGLILELVGPFQRLRGFRLDQVAYLLLKFQEAGY
ncbi:RNA polymerase, Rpb8, partial [Kipferlia bialata]